MSMLGKIKICSTKPLCSGRPSVGLAAGVCEAGGIVRTAVSTGMLIAEAFRLGLTPVYVNGLGACAKRVAGKSRGDRRSLLYWKSFPNYAPGKASYAATVQLRRTERESAITKKQNRAW